jgi:hypothetical protein
MGQLWKSLLTVFTLTTLVVHPARSLEIISGPEVVADEGSALVVWETDVECGGRIHFGESAKDMRGRASGPVTRSHEVTLTDLMPGTTYHFTVGSARKKLGQGAFTTEGTAPAKPKMAPAEPEQSAKPKVPTEAPPTRLTWGWMASLQDHFDRHGKDFQSRSPDHYAAQAWIFLQRARLHNLPMKWDGSDDTLRVWDPRSRAFAAYNEDGTTKTYFKPNSPTYWDRQPGRLVQPDEVPFFARTNR